jgi:hypothetical protein
MLPIDPNVRFSLDAGTSSLFGHSVRINAHFVHDDEKSGKTSLEGQGLCWKKTSIWYTLSASQREYCTGPGILWCRGIGFVDAGQSETRIPSFVISVLHAWCMFHRLSQHYVTTQQPYLSQHHLTPEAYTSEHNVQTLDH